jgi:hypothetical protein
MDRDAIRVRLASARGYFDSAGIDIEKLLGGYLDSVTMYGPDYPRQQLADIDTDLFPRDEFDLTPQR